MTPFMLKCTSVAYFHTWIHEYLICRHCVSTHNAHIYFLKDNLMKKTIHILFKSNIYGYAGWQKLVCSFTVKKEQRFHFLDR